MVAVFAGGNNAPGPDWYASGLRAGVAAALALATPIVLLAFWYASNRESNRSSLLGDFMLARTAVGLVFPALGYAYLVVAAAEKASDASCVTYYLLAFAAASALGVALAIITLDAATWNAGNVDRLPVAMVWVAGPWICGGGIPLLFWRRTVE